MNADIPLSLLFPALATILADPTAIVAAENVAFAADYAMLL
jgi:hypothetical protein